jgi:hypothetical protein
MRGKARLHFACITTSGHRMTGKVKLGLRYRDSLPISSSHVLGLPLIGSCRPVLPIYLPTFHVTSKRRLIRVNTYDFRQVLASKMTHLATNSTPYNVTTFWGQIGSGRRCRLLRRSRFRGNPYVTRGSGWMICSLPASCMDISICV